MISTTTLTHAARVALQGYLTAAFFKEIVVDRTIQVVSRSEKVSISLVTSTVRSSTAVLLLATAKAAQQFLSDDRQGVPAHKDADDTAELNAPFAGDSILDSTSTTKTFGAPTQPSSSRAVTESTEPAFDGPAGGLSTIDSNTTFIARDGDLDKNVFDDDLEWLADESTFCQDDCQATTQCLADDEREHILHAASDSHTINNLIRRMAALSLDPVLSHISTYSLDDVPLSTISLDDVSSHVSTISLDNVPSHISTISLADVPSQCDSHTIDLLIRRMAALSLDDVPSYISTIPLDNVPSHISTISLADVPSCLSPSLDNVSFDDVPSHFSTLSLDHVPSHLTSILSLDNVSFDDVPSYLSPLSLDHVPSHLSTLRSHLDNGSPPPSKCQPQRNVVHDHAIDDLVRKMVALSLDNVPSRLSKLRPHLHDHAIDVLLQRSETLALNDNYAIDTVTLALDENSTINILALDGNHAIDALLHKSDALTLNNHAIQVDALLHRSDAHTLDDNASQPWKHMLHDNTDDNSGYQHLRRHSANTLFRNIKSIDPQNFNYDRPYTTMLSTPYFEIWSLLFLTITPQCPHSRQNVRHNTP